jgi:hypothetical protein
VPLPGQILDGRLARGTSSLRYGRVAPRRDEVVLNTVDEVGRWLLIARSGLLRQVYAKSARGAYGSPAQQNLYPSNGRDVSIFEFTRNTFHFVTKTIYPLSKKIWFM